MYVIFRVAAAWPSWKMLFLFLRVCRRFCRTDRFLRTGPRASRLYLLVRASSLHRLVRA